jgi:hypothetical protein
MRDTAPGTAGAVATTDPVQAAEATNRAAQFIQRSLDRGVVLTEEQERLMLALFTDVVAEEMASAPAVTRAVAPVVDLIDTNESMRFDGRLCRWVPVSDGAEQIVTERIRQRCTEGWTPEHDDEHVEGELARAAACYAKPAEARWPTRGVPVSWPWSPGDWKPDPDDRIRELVKAGALIAAEIDRLARARERERGSDA